MSAARMNPDLPYSHLMGMAKGRGWTVSTDTDRGSVQVVVGASTAHGGCIRVSAAKAREIAAHLIAAAEEAESANAERRAGRSS